MKLKILCFLQILGLAYSISSYDSDKKQFDTTYPHDSSISFDDGFLPEIMESKLNYQKSGVNPTGEFMPYDFIKSDKSMHETWQNDKKNENHRHFPKVIKSKLNDQASGINNKEEFVPYDSIKSDKSGETTQNYKNFEDYRPFAKVIESKLNDQTSGINNKEEFVPYDSIKSDKSGETKQNNKKLEDYKPLAKAIESKLNDQTLGVNPKGEFVPYDFFKSDKSVYETTQNNKNFEDYIPLAKAIESKLNEQTSGINNKEEFVPDDFIKSDKSGETTQSNKNFEDYRSLAKAIESKLNDQTSGINNKEEFVPYDSIKSDKSGETTQNNKNFEDYRPLAKAIESKLNDQTLGVNPKGEFVPYDFFKSDKSVYETTQNKKNFEAYRPFAKVVESKLNDQTSGINPEGEFVPFDSKDEEDVYETTKNDKDFEDKLFPEVTESQLYDRTSEINSGKEFLPYDFTKRGGNSYKIPNNYENAENSLSLSETAKESGVQPENDHRQKEEIVEQSQKYVSLPKSDFAYDNGYEKNYSEKYEEIKSLPGKYLKDSITEENSSVQRNFKPLQDGIETPEKALPKQKTNLKQLERDYEAPEVIRERQDDFHQKYLDGDLHLPDYNQKDINAFEKSPEKYEEFTKSSEERKIVNPQLYTAERNDYMDDQDNYREVEKSVKKKQTQIKKHEWNAMRTDVHQDDILHRQTYPEEQESGTKILNREGVSDFAKENNDMAPKFSNLNNYLKSFVPSFGENTKEIEVENTNSDESKIISTAPEVVAKESAIETYEKVYNVKDALEKGRKQLKHILHQDNTIPELENTDYENDLKKQKSFSDPQRIVVKPQVTIKEMSEEIPELHKIEEIFTKTGELFKNAYQIEKLETSTMMANVEDSQYKENLHMRNLFNEIERIIIRPLHMDYEKDLKKNKSFSDPQRIIVKPQVIIKEMSEEIPEQHKIEEIFTKTGELFKNAYQLEKPETPTMMANVEDSQYKENLHMRNLFNEIERIINSPLQILKEMSAVVPKQSNIEDIIKIEEQLRDLRQLEKPKTPVVTMTDFGDLKQEIKLQKYGLFNESKRIIITPMPFMEEMIAAISEKHDTEDTFKEPLSEIREERQNMFLNEKSKIPIALTEIDNLEYTKSAKKSTLLNEPQHVSILPQVITNEMVIDIPEKSSREEPDTTKDQLLDDKAAPNKYMKNYERSSVPKIIFDVVAKNNNKYMAKPLNLSKNVKTDFYLQSKSDRQELERETLTPSSLRDIPKANTPTQGKQESGSEKARPRLFKQYERYMPVLQIFNGEQRKLSATPKIVKELGQHSGLTKQISYLAEKLDGFFEAQESFGDSNGFSSTAVKLFLTPEVKSQKLDQLSAKQSRIKDGAVSSHKQECSYRASFAPKDNSKDFVIKISYICKTVPGHQNKKSNILKPFLDYLYDPKRILHNEGNTFVKRTKHYNTFPVFDYMPFVSLAANQAESKFISDQLNKNNSPFFSMIPHDLRTEIMVKQPMQFLVGLGYKQKMPFPYHFTVGTENDNEQRKKTVKFPKKLMKKVRKLLKKFQRNNNPRVLLKISELISGHKFQPKIPMKNTKINNAAMKIEEWRGKFLKLSEEFEKYRDISHSEPMINSDFVIQDLKPPMEKEIVGEQNRINKERSEHIGVHSSNEPEQSNKLPETEEHAEHNFEKVKQLEKLDMQVEPDVKQPYEVPQRPKQFDELFPNLYYQHEPEIKTYAKDQNINKFTKLDSFYKSLEKIFHLSPDVKNTTDEILNKRFFTDDSKDVQKRINIEDKYGMQIPK